MSKTDARDQNSSNISKAHRLGLFALFLACGLLVFVVSYFISGELNIQTFWVPVVFLVSALAMLQRTQFKTYGQVFFAFFIFSFVWFFRHSVLDSSLVQPFYSTLGGNVIAQFIDSTLVIVSIILLTLGFRAKLSSIFLKKGNLKLGLSVGLIVLAIFYMLSAIVAISIAGMSFGRFLFLTPYLLVLALTNGFKEELWFRGLFLNKYEPILGLRLSNFLQAPIFAASLVEGEFSSILFGIALFAFFLGLGLGYLMRRTGSILGPSLCEAGSTIPIFLMVISSLR
jgi:membrane protease YdiL (CAAX protease family)